MDQSLVCFGKILKMFLRLIYKTINRKDREGTLLTTTDDFAKLPSCSEKKNSKIDGLEYNEE